MPEANPSERHAGQRIPKFNASTEVHARTGPLPSPEDLKRYLEAERLLRHAELEREVRASSVRSAITTLVALISGVVAALPDFDKRVIPSIAVFTKAHSTALIVSGTVVVGGLGAAQVFLFLWRRRSENDIRRGAQEITMHIRRAYRDALAISELNPAKRAL